MYKVTNPQSKQKLFISRHKIANINTWIEAEPMGMSTDMPDEQVDKALLLPTAMNRNLSMYTSDVNNFYLSLSVVISVAL